MVLPKKRSANCSMSYVEDFDPDNPKYKFCCESIKATYGSVIVGFLQLLMSAGIFSFIMVENNGNVVLISCGIGFLVISILFVGISFYGIKFDKAVFIFPFLILEVR